MDRLIDIVIPSYNNPEYLNPCIISILNSGILEDLGTLHIVNNGSQDLSVIKEAPNMVLHEPGENLGWEKGLQFALERSKAPYVVFQNDDTFIPFASRQFYQRLLIPFADKNVAAVSPTTTTALGMQSIYHPSSPQSLTETSYLIFYTVMVRRNHLEEVGGIDTAAPGGDDFDLSIRFRKAGKKLLIEPGAFLIHHGFKTGERIRGGPEIKGGWNSASMTDRTNQYLIRKHGFKTFMETVNGLFYPKPEHFPDLEGDLVRSYLNGDKQVVELGCGSTKTIDRAIGVDRVKRGAIIPFTKKISNADIEADVTQPLPFDSNSQDALIGRHIFEHCIDLVSTLKNWHRILKPGGRLILAVPDETVSKGIPTNFEHVHAFTPESLKNLVETCGFRELEAKYTNNGVSFVGCYEKLQ